jgi:hypothetical protein
VEQQCIILETFAAALEDQARRMQVANEAF